MELSASNEYAIGANALGNRVKSGNADGGNTCAFDFF
jgi:hypothetical protein